jgi:hypothetical protein
LFDEYEICKWVYYDKYELCENQVVPDNSFTGTGLAIYDVYEWPQINYDFSGGVGGQTIQVMPDEVWSGHGSTGLAYTGGALTNDQTGISYSETSEPTPWSPSEDTSLVAQWDASETSTITESAGSITKITDVETTSIDLTANGTPTNTTVNGLNAINIVRSSNERFVSTSRNWGITDGDIIVIGVAGIDSVNHERDAFWSIRDNGGANNDIHLRAGNSSKFNGQIETAGLGASSANLSGGSKRNLAGGPYSGITLHATVCDFSNSDIFVKINGTQRLFVGNEYLTKVDMVNADLFFHANRGGNRELDGKFCELLMFNSNNTDLLEKAEGYLAHKWGIEGNLPSAHPYKSGPPNV